MATISEHPTPDPSPPNGGGTRDDLTRLLADLAIASRIIAPQWPLTSFVAVNPLRGLEHLPFDSACSEAMRWLGARTHLSEREYRESYAAGSVGSDHLQRAVAHHDPLLLIEAPLPVGEHPIEAIDIVIDDLLHGPLGPETDRIPTHDPWHESMRDYIGTWCSTFVDESGAALAMPGRERGFYRAWQRLIARDPRLRQLVGRDGRNWIGSLPDDPLAALAVALDFGTPGERLDVLRSLLVALPGWAGFARWSDDWAPANRAGPRFHLVDLVAVVAVVHAAAGRTPAALASVDRDRPVRTERSARIESAAERLRLDPDDRAGRAAVASILDRVDEPTRAAIWLEAHESAYRDMLLLALDQRTAPTAEMEPPIAQIVTCIDVRSEVLRRHIEATGPYETFGFAGFFGVPVRWRPAGSDHAEARCPVLVTPQREVAELADLPTGPLARHGGRGAGEALHAAKGHLGAPFALAESAGWILGPMAAFRTLLRRVRPTPPRRERRSVAAVAAEDHATSGLPLDERVTYAEAIISTIDLRDCAPLVVLCGHGSRTVNNVHASALDCGACGGAAGGPSARVAAAILNDVDVRDALVDRGITIPTTTWFVAAEHDTASDVVELLDIRLVPPSHQALIDRLERDLAAAGERASHERARSLPGDARRIRARGRDWAQVRPEWGLAGNAAFLAAPRSASRGVDLGGRTFLHSYEASADPTGAALETILTAPLVVAQWINSQYYFSSVDPEVFGAGDKTILNPTGGTGALRGVAGDLAVGLPEQSVAVGERRVHEPLRLLAVVQAPIDRIEGIIQRNPTVRDLLEHEWIHLVARADADDPWSVRSPAGTWTTWFPVGPIGAGAAMVGGR